MTLIGRSAVEKRLRLIIFEAEELQIDANQALAALPYGSPAIIAVKLDEVASQSRKLNGVATEVVNSTYEDPEGMSPQLE